MADYLPSKRFLLVIGSFLAVSLIIVFVFQFAGGKKTVTNNAVAVGKPKTTLKDLIEKDSDKDGVPDWEEALWETDPAKIDSDGNGISDREEINARRQALNLSENVFAKENLNETEIFARDLFTTVSALKAAGELNQESLVDLSIALSQSVAEENLPPILKANNLKQVPDTKENNQIYYEEMSKLVEKYSRYELGSEMEFFEIGIKQEDKNGLKKLQNLAAGYAGFSQDLMAIAVPTNLASNHLKMINTTGAMAMALNKMAGALENPMLAIQGLAGYQEASEEFKTAIDVWSEFLATI